VGAEAVATAAVSPSSAGTVSAPGVWNSPSTPVAGCWLRRRRGRGRTGREGLRERTIHSRQRALDVGQRTDDLELKERSPLDHVLGAPLIRLRGARKLDHDALLTHLLDHRLGHAELVDPGADHAQRAVDRILPLLGGQCRRRIGDLQGEMSAPAEVQAEHDPALCQHPATQEEQARDHGKAYLQVFEHQRSTNSRRGRQRGMDLPGVAPDTHSRQAAKLPESTGSCQPDPARKSPVRNTLATVPRTRLYTGAARKFVRLVKLNGSQLRTASC
jgi:hypothetical protein